MALPYPYVHTNSVPWSPDFTNLIVNSLTTLVHTADFVGDFPATFANIPNRFEEGAKVRNMTTGAFFTNVGTVSVPNFLEVEDDAGELSKTLSSGDIFVGNGSNIATGVTMSQDGEIDNIGAFTVVGIREIPIAAMVPASTQFGAEYYFDGTQIQNTDGGTSATASNFNDTAFIVGAKNHQTVGGNATEVISMNNVDGDCQIFAQMSQVGAASTIISAIVLNPNQISVTFNQDPTNNTFISILVTRNLDWF